MRLAESIFGESEEEYKARSLQFEKAFKKYKEELLKQDIESRPKISMQEAFEKINVEVSSYSGRGMFGKHCLSIYIDRLTDLLNIGFRLGKECNIDLKDLTISYDSLGKGIVVYFPYIPFNNEVDLEVDL